MFHSYYKRTRITIMHNNIDHFLRDKKELEGKNSASKGAELVNAALVVYQECTGIGKWLVFHIVVFLDGPVFCLWHLKVW